MKKTIAILLSMFLILSLAACGNSASRAEEQSSAEENSVEHTTNDVESAENSSTGNVGSTDVSEIQPEKTETPEVQGTKVLVAYFSATNTTEGVAEHIANGLNADLYEIVPEDPYTDADLNYNDNKSRTTIEMNDPNARPAIFGSVENMEQYDIVFIGYPIWWGEAPRIVSTFMESYNFSGKTIVPFCTSGGSGMGSSATNLEKLTSGAKWLSGRRLNGRDSQDTVMEWVNSLALDLGE
ncbi:MAG: NAD(P)H-dependent oxidoreductase [Lachnospiraceae bacterium]|nr:NAD(P)H-dependent oxidoreductase [Lachnospiraceae bacterium]